MAKFLKRNNEVSVFPNGSIDVEDKLGPGNYLIKSRPDGSLYLERIGEFVVDGKLYGTIEADTVRILDTFLDRPSTTGVLLAGEKGCGKSLLAKNICKTASEQGIPTIIISFATEGEEYRQFIASIDQPCIILIDEFEKIYDFDSQQQMLTLLDGVFSTKKLFILTCNDAFKIDSHLMNRPGRIYYNLQFDGVSQDFIREYCADNLKDMSYLEKILNFSCLFISFNFDMLKAIVEELNRIGGDFRETVRFLNIRPEHSASREYRLSVTIRETGETYAPITTARINPLDVEEDEIHWRDTAREFHHLDLKQNMIKYMNKKLSVIEVETEKYDITFTEVEENKYDYWKMV